MPVVRTANRVTAVDVSLILGVLVALSAVVWLSVLTLFEAADIVDTVSAKLNERRAGKAPTARAGYKIYIGGDSDSDVCDTLIELTTQTAIKEWR